MPYISSLAWPLSFEVWPFREGQSSWLYLPLLSLHDRNQANRVIMTVFVIGWSTSCSVQRQVISFSFEFLRKWYVDFVGFIENTFLSDLHYFRSNSILLNYLWSFLCKIPIFIPSCDIHYLHVVYFIIIKSIRSL